MYDPYEGRWLEQDPTPMLKAGPNPYEAMGNAPTDFTDPSGLAEIKTVAGTGTAQKLKNSTFGFELADGTELFGEVKRTTDVSIINRDGVQKDAVD